MNRKPNLARIRRRSMPMPINLVQPAMARPDDLSVRNNLMRQTQKRKWTARPGVFAKKLHDRRPR